MWHANAELLAKLVARNARFVIVGSAAVKFYLPEREVDDLDLLVDPILTNAETIVDAINSSGIPCPCEPSALTNPRAQLSIKNYYYLDIITPDSSTTFGHVWATAIEGKVEYQWTPIPVRIAGISTLLTMLDRAQKRSTNSMLTC